MLCCDNHFGRADERALSDQRTFAANRSGRGAERRLLVVEPRNEVFAILCRDAEGCGFAVARAVFGAEVSRKAKRFEPHLVLISDVRADEGCWLIAAKLRLVCRHLRVWVYTADGARRAYEPWQHAADVERIIYCDGSHRRLSRAVREELFSPRFLSIEESCC